MSTQTTAALAAAPVNARHADLAGRRLATVPSGRDTAADTTEPRERIARHPHRRRSHPCVCSPAHVIAGAGCLRYRTRRRAVNIAVDELSAEVALAPTRSGGIPHGPATRRIVRCRASIATGAPESVQDGRR
ncbi:hypothetical protein [Actinophytocola sp.]|uniref:hypothetical protein n=1 Tax=Actinophytocola sp. TaxID=1872138 RepID=UPI002D4E7D0B|nr:hypothetical protein [Actinophytocola sp.]HYQ63393.1 hypothetical protein [Actinophytocola sp.]